MPTALLLDPIYKQHETDWDHPEAPERIDAIRTAFEEAGLATRALRLAPREATLDELARAHHPAYIDQVLRTIAGGARWLANGDVSVCRESGKIARLAAGGVLRAVDALFSGACTNAFCAVRPPGHHATASQAMGFCIFNNVALAARHAQTVHGVERIAILDWDVHHGNGTQEIFHDDDSVLFCSTHQSPWYPGTGAKSETGAGRGKSFTINRPFPSGAGHDEILGAFTRDFLPAVERFQPGLILISAGFDSRIGDPLGGFRLTDADFADLTVEVLKTADRCCKGRVISVLEGGYNSAGLASATAAHFRALLEGQSTQPANTEKSLPRKFSEA